MRTIPIALANHQALPSTTMATAIRITRRDGEVYAFTGGSDDVTIDGVLYGTAQGLRVSSLETTSGLGVDNLELTTLNDGSVFTKFDIRAGVWKNAEFEIFDYNWASPSDGIDSVFGGTFGEIEVRGAQVVVELRGLQQHFQQVIAKTVSPLCRARLGDAQCTVYLEPFTGFGEITTVTSRQVFRSNSRSYYPDPFFASNVLLLPFDGADGSTVFTDYSPTPKSASAAGNAQIDTAQSKFGGASGLFDGTGDVVSFADHADFEFAAGDFTIEFWLRPSQVAAAKRVMGKANGSGYGPFMIYQNLTVLQLNMASASGSWDIAASVGIGTVAANTWYHVAVTRKGRVVRAFLDGALAFQFSTTAALFNNADALTIGSDRIAAPDAYAGWIDDLRITKGAARYTAAFTPPVAAHDTANGATVMPPIEADDRFGEGIITFLTGANAGRQQKIKTYIANGTFTTMLPMPATVAIGDTFSAIAGCRKRDLLDCRDKFDNILNLDAEPDVPNMDHLTATP